jgi:hypothetical protein
MSWRAAGCLLFAVAFLAGCESEGSEAEQEGENANAPAAQTVRHFYDAANRSAGKDACALLTPSGMQQIVHVSSSAACSRTIDGFAPGSFSSEKGELLQVKGVDERGDDGFAVDARLTGRSGGTYVVVRRDGTLLIDGFESDEG